MARFLQLVLIIWAASLILYPLHFLLFGIPISELDWPAAAVGSLVIVTAALIVIGIPAFALAHRLGYADNYLIMAATGGLLGFVLSAVGIGAAYEDAFTKALDSVIFWITYSAVLGTLAALTWCGMRARKMVNA